MLRFSSSRRSATWAAISLFALVTGGCGGSSASSRSCGTHHYAYIGGAGAVVAGAPWYNGYGDGYGYGYGGSSGGGWYDPGDDGSDYSNEGSSGSGGSYDDGSGSSGGGSGDDGSYYDDGSGDDGSGSSGSGDDGSYGDGTGNDGSGDDGSGDDGSGDDGSGDDGTASKKHLHTASASLHTQSSPRTNSCYAYTCALVCVVGNPSTQEREARGLSAISTADACATAAHGIETWAHQALGQDVTGCKRVNDDGTLPASSNADGARMPATPSVGQARGSSSASGTARSYIGTAAPR